MDLGMRIHPDDDPLFQLRSKGDVGEKTLTGPENGGLLAKANLALHKSRCKGLCGLHFSEPEEYLTVHITSKARVADALKVIVCPLPHYHSILVFNISGKARSKSCRSRNWLQLK